MKKIILFIILTFIIFTSCIKNNQIILVKRISPIQKKIKIFWKSGEYEVYFENIRIKKQGVYYMFPKEYSVRWKYKILSNKKQKYIYMSKKIDISNCKEIIFIKNNIEIK